MTNTENELKQCSKCHSTILLKYFEVNRKGELLKTCNHCRKVKQTYRESRKEEIHEYDKIYREQHKEQIQLQKMKYRAENKELINAYRQQTITCQCGKIYQVREKARHERSNKHLSYLEVADELKAYEN